MANPDKQKTSETLRASLLALTLMVFGVAAIAASKLMPNPATKRFAIVFPPTVSAEYAFAATSQWGAIPLAPGFAENIIYAVAPAGPIADRPSNAWLVLDAAGLGGCGNYRQSSNRQTIGPLS